MDVILMVVVVVETQVFQMITIFLGGGSIWFGGTNAFIFRVWSTQLHKHITELCNFHIHYCENLKSFMSLCTKYSVIIWEIPKKI